MKSCHHSLLSPVIALCFATATAHAQTLTWNSPVISNPDGAGSANVSENAIDLSLQGGSNINVSNVRLSSSTTYPELDFTSSDSDGVLLRMRDLEIAGSSAGAKILYVTISNTPAANPYGMATGLSLEIRADGSFSMGWRENYTGSGGWPSRSAATVLESATAATYQYSGVDLFLTQHDYRLILYTSDQQTQVYTGLIAWTEQWGDLGVNMVLQKTAAGESTWASASIGDFSFQAIPEPFSTGMLAAGGAMAFLMGYRNRKQKGK